jgi:hypothetical protein
MIYRLAVVVGILSIPALVIGGSHLLAQTRTSSMPAADQALNPVPDKLNRGHQGIPTKPNKPNLPLAGPERKVNDELVPSGLGMPHR